MEFKLLTKKILNDPENIKLVVNGKTKEIRAFTRLTSRNYLSGEYWKIKFTDNSYLLLILQDEEIYYSDQYKLYIKDIIDDQIGRDPMIKFRGKEYKLGNKDDYQYVKELVFGSLLDIEGECRFSDYFPVSGEKEFLSLGWLSETGKRADIWCRKITAQEIKLL